MHTSKLETYILASHNSTKRSLERYCWNRNPEDRHVIHQQTMGHKYKKKTLKM